MIPTPGELNIAMISDIHLGHNRVSATSILHNLEIAFPSNLETAKLDIIFIAGDLFDQILTIPEEQVFEIKAWMIRLLQRCKRLNIKLRILFGTPSHDRNQGVLFENLNGLLTIGADCKYISTLTIEYIEDFNINVLYIPDEWRLDPDDTWEDVQVALRDNNLEKVDYAIMHGMFEYQLPLNVRLPCHNSERYLSIVKKYISIGHYHHMSRYDRILAQGSFDRLAHGEEGAKGHFRLKVTNDDTTELDEIHFIENKGATIFKTITLTGLEEAEVEEKLNSVIDYPTHSHIRVIMEKNSPHLGLVDSFRKMYSNYHWTVKLSQVNDGLAAKIEFKNNYEVTEIRADDLVGILIKRLEEKGYERHVIKRAVKLLEEVKC